MSQSKYNTNGGLHKCYRQAYQVNSFQKALGRYFQVSGWIFIRNNHLDIFKQRELGDWSEGHCKDIGTQILHLSNWIIENVEWSSFKK